ncbi:MAG: metallophosphoesterase [Clostridia bacterium]|nr:metallophosphoesterase [Clostridia bacterium]
MKKIIAVILSATLLLTGMCVSLTPALAADTVDTTSADALAATLGATGSNLILSEGFDTDGVTPFTATTVTAGNVLENTNVVTDGKWVVGAASNKDLAFTTGFTGKKLGDFIASFEFSSNRGWGGSSFYYHSTSGGGNAFTYRLVLKSGAGYASTFVLEKKGNTTTEYSSCAGPIIYNSTDKSWKIFNVVLVSKGNIDAAYIWEKGTEMPDTPTLQITTASKTTGDMYYYSYQDTAVIDDIKVYDLSAVSPENMKTATGLDLNDKNLVYENDLNSTTTVPAPAFSGANYTGDSNAVVDGKWQTTGRLGTSKGLLGREDLTNFAYGFQFSLTNVTSSSYYADFGYHSTTGWPNLNNGHRLNMYASGSNFGFTLDAGGSESPKFVSGYTQGDTINVIMTYVDQVVDTYIWKLGEAVPTTPTLTVSSAAVSSGDFYFHLAFGTFELDNFYVYDLTDTTLYPENISQATGYELDEDMLVYSNDFENTTTVPATYFNAYNEGNFNPSSTISDGKWVTGGTFGTNTGLTGMPFLKNFAYGFQLEFGSTGAYARFVYHSTTGWNGSEVNNVLEMSKSGDNLTFNLYGNDNIDSTDLSTLKSSTTTTLTTADKVNIVMTYVDGKVSAYIWKAGTAVPTAPTLTVDALVASSGDFYFSFYGHPLMLDNFYVYDLTAEDSDGVYTTMESSYRMNKLLDTYMPKTIETTIKLPTIFTGGAGNTILGNYADKDWTFSFEINANGNPYVVYNPPWREWKKLTFDMIDVRTGEWEHLALVLENANGEAPTLTCRLNGDEIVQTLAIPAEVNSSNSPFIDYKIGADKDDVEDRLFIGRDTRGGHDKYYFKGKIKNLTMFSDVRTVDEIKADMVDVSASAADLIADYDFEGCYGTGVKDNSSNGYDLVNWGYMATDPEAPTDYAYSFAVVGDTQILNYHYPKQFTALYDWLSDEENIENHKIKYVMGLGDITDRDYDIEWERAATEIAKLNGKVPYSLVRGNHDSEEKFTKYMTEVYKGQTDGCLNDDINNSYKIFTAGEVDYMVINLNMGAIDSELAWAEELIKTHPNHTVIITTHIYLDSDGEYIDKNNGNVSGTHCRTDSTANNGDDIWNELVSKYSNVSMVLSGHINTTEVVVKKATGVNGNTVTQMLIDPQCTDESYSAGPTGLVTMLYFSEDGKTVQVRNYSTVRDEYFGAHNQFTMEVAATEYLYGDANDDAQVDICDLVRVHRGLDKGDVSYNNRTADLNKDKLVDLLDLSALRQKLLDLIS